MKVSICCIVQWTQGTPLNGYVCGEVTYLLPAETKESENGYLIKAAKITRLEGAKVGIWKLKSVKKGEEEPRKSLERGPEK